MKYCPKCGSYDYDEDHGCGQCAQPPPKKMERTNDKWTEYEAPWVSEVEGVPFTYRVQSRSEPGMAHTVDLTQRGGHGACTCQFFQIRAASNFRRHQSHIPYAPKREGVSECAHIAAAREYCHVHVVIPMLAKFSRGIEKS
jgi:hypothetical protein